MKSRAVMNDRAPLGSVTPSQQNRDVGVDFSKLTPSQFGISTDSFLTFPKDNNKSRVAQLKARRRSTIGVRGSPETNSLICFRAKQAMKTPPRTPQHVLSSPLFTGCDSIKQKMAAFQRLMEEDEQNEDKASSTPVMEESEEGETGGGLQNDAEGRLVERESKCTPTTCPPPVTPPPSKRRRRVPRGLCEEEIQEERQSDLPNTPEPEAGVGSCDLWDLKPTQDLQSDSQSKLLSFPMLSQPKTARIDVAEASSTKKRVRFGAPLSPEFFDKTLPPSTPLQRGAAPPGPPSSTGQKRSLLKTPQRLEAPLPQPTFSAGGHGASPTLAGSTCASADPSCDDMFMGPLKINFFMEDEFEKSPAERTDSAKTEDNVIPLAADSFLNAAFQEDEASLGHSPIIKPPLSAIDSAQTEDNVIPLAADSSLLNAAFQEDEASLGHSPIIKPPLSAIEPETNPEVQQQQEKVMLESPASTPEAPRSRIRKRKSPGEGQPSGSRRSARSAASTAKRKMKTAAAKKSFGSKEVDRSLYGKRDYASKNPVLSPIFEAAASNVICTPPHPHPASNPDCSQTTSPSIPLGNISPEETASLLSAAALWRRRFLLQANEGNSESKLTNRITHPTVMDTPASDSPVSEARSGVSHADGVGSGAARRGRGRRATRRRSNVSRAETKTVAGERTGKSRNVEEPERDSAAGQQTRHESCDSCESREAPTEEEEAEEHRSVSGAEPSGDQREREEKHEQELAKPSVAMGQDEIRETSMERSGGRVEDMESVLESWQQEDFCIEDILKPIVRVQGSVRRSLRNRRSMDAQASGLAWVERTPPEQSTASRRKTQARLSAMLECTPLQLASREEEEPAQPE